MLDKFNKTYKSIIREDAYPEDVDEGEGIDSMMEQTVAEFLGDFDDGQLTRLQGVLHEYLGTPEGSSDHSIRDLLSMVEYEQVHR